MMTFPVGRRCPAGLTLIFIKTIALPQEPIITLRMPCYGTSPWARLRASPGPQLEFRPPMQYLELQHSLQGDVHGRREKFRKSGSCCLGASRAANSTYREVRKI